MRSVMSRLGAIRAVFRAPTSLDAQEHARLDLVGAVTCPMHELRAQQKVGQCRRVDRLDVVEGPVVTNHGFGKWSGRGLEPVDRHYGQYKSVAGGW
jgi:hypothetical protein